MSIISVEEWKRFHIIADEESQSITRLTDLINDELKGNSKPPFTINITFTHPLSQEERAMINNKIKRILNAAGWKVTMIYHDADTCRITFDIDN